LSYVKHIEILENSKNYVFQLKNNKKLSIIQSQIPPKTPGPVKEGGHETKLKNTKRILDV